MAVLTYKCPNCDAELTFRPESQMFACDYCGGQFTQQEMERLDPATDSRVSEEPQPQEDGQAVCYQCPSCGAQLMTEGTTAATYCYYCHNPVTVGERLSGQWKPDSIIPFSVSEAQAKEKFLNWCKKNPFVDRRFFSGSQLEKFSGIYFPFWLASSQNEVSAEATARKIRVWRAGDVEYTETSVYELIRGGESQTRNYDMAALNREETGLLEGILTYDYERTVAFSTSYLSGFQAERRDREKSELEPRTKEEVKRHIDQLLRDSFAGYQSVSMKRCDVQEKSADWKYLLLPAWILTYQYQGKKYFFAMNGQNGDVNGKLPISKLRMAKLFGIVSGICFVLLMAGGYFL
ncbi:MAG: TFIIB-type zinc ribbon-containing protein [Oscillospiraceae bacterium]|nr:TFIIB-type zinc ribbon-containing protein [Oscillospiraceae bacterium]